MDIQKFTFLFLKTGKLIFMQQVTTEWNFINHCSFFQKLSTKMLFTKKSTLFLYQNKMSTLDLNINSLLLNTYQQDQKKLKSDLPLKLTWKWISYQDLFSSEAQEYLLLIILKIFSIESRTLKVLLGRQN